MQAMPSREHARVARAKDQRDPRRQGRSPSSTKDVPAVPQRVKERVRAMMEGARMMDADFVALLNTYAPDMKSKRATSGRRAPSPR